MTDTDLLAGYNLIKQGALVNFDIVETKVDESVGRDEAIVRIDLHLGEMEDEEYRSEDHEWGAFGFLFCLATLAFADARPRGVSEMHFDEQDEFTVADFFDGLRYERGEVRFSADYVRGRCVKTDLTVRPDGTATVETRCRGEAATRWVTRLKGKKMLSLVQ
jgi:hypothetical protein